MCFGFVVCVCFFFLYFLVAVFLFQNVGVYFVFCKFLQFCLHQRFMSGLDYFSYAKFLVMNYFSINLECNQNKSGRIPVVPSSYNQCIQCRPFNFKTSCNLLAFFYPSLVGFQMDFSNFHPSCLELPSRWVFYVVIVVVSQTMFVLHYTGSIWN